MIKYLSESQQKALLDAAKSRRDPLAQRDYHWMGLMLSTGARVTEFSLWTLTQAEAALATGWLVSTPDQRKGKKKAHEYLVTETVRLHLQALIMISRQEQTPALGEEAPLIWGREGQPLAVRSYQSRLKLWVKEAGLDPRFTVHSLRHSRAMNIMRRSRGASPLKTTQRALGHTSLASTGMYTDCAREEYAQELRQVDGRRMPKAQARSLAMQQQAGGRQ
ncbi:tyrosine-type recombinase/integrase [Paucibacter sp. Y2R2-4]|uniref:tyrosine-type recombinase/integrase n=1 Tax=Paucibacter sp. Y2R2-4 TaxID=2893553 RepID=UPI0021E48BA1|nr:site-specific integrase [Paucibacter sp. Y2R2-4]MCV2349321.1 site-specific integrase [Paucibacter sp. Y2R2-4]